MARRADLICPPGADLKRFIYSNPPKEIAECRRTFPGRSIRKHLPAKIDSGAEVTAASSTLNSLRLSADSIPKYEASSPGALITPAYSLWMNHSPRGPKPVNVGSPLAAIGHLSGYIAI